MSSNTTIVVNNGASKTEITAPNGSKTEVTGVGVIIVNINDSSTSDVLEPPLLRIIGDTNNDGIESNAELDAAQGYIKVGATPRSGARVGDSISVTDGYSEQTQVIASITDELIFSFLPIVFDTPINLVGRVIRAAYSGDSTTTQIIVANNNPAPYQFLTGLTVGQVEPNTESTFNHLLNPIVGANLSVYVGHSFAIALTAGSELRLQLHEVYENYIALTTGRPVPDWIQASESAIRLAHGGEAYYLTSLDQQLSIATDANSWLRIVFSASNVLEFYDGISGEIVKSVQLDASICYFSLFRFYQTQDSLPIGLQLNPL